MMTRLSIVMTVLFVSAFVAAAQPEIEMVFVKGGKFRMGCSVQETACLGDERPVHEVYVGHFLMGKYPITQRQWKAVMDTNSAYFQGDAEDDDRPVEQVSWSDAQEFIKRLNAMTGLQYRLPTEAEWEYAARGGAKATQEKFWGNRFLDDIGWYEYNSGGKTHPVGRKNPNPLGLYDMIGNVWEWVSDWHDPFYYRVSPVRNPTGARTGTSRVCRGGSFNTTEQNCRFTIRNNHRPYYRGIDVGFRLVRKP